MTNAFLKVRCSGCNNEQIVFSRAASRVNCNSCNEALVVPTGGDANILGEVVATLN